MKLRWILLIAVGIAVTVFAGVVLYAYYSIGISPIPMHYEKLEYTYYNVYLAPSRDFIVELRLRNVGSVNLTTNELFVNGTSWNERDDTIYENVTGIKLAPGQSENGILILSRGNTWTDLVQFEITVMTLAGREYPRTIVLAAVPSTPTSAPLPSFELVWITSVSQYSTPNGDFALLLNVTNEGGVNVTIEGVIARRVPYGPQGDIIYESITGMTLAPGESKNGIIILRRGDTWTDGVDLSLFLITASREYSTMITLI